jgi:isoleucyl-tRNA synthetase
VSDFDAGKDMLLVEQWLEIDRYALALTRELQESCRADYDRYEFHRVVQALQTFCSEDLGGFYLDILKDRLYTTDAISTARRSAQSALWHITQSFVRLLAPITAFTAEEVWTVLINQSAEDGLAATLKNECNDSVMFQLWHELPKPEGESDLLAKWAQIREVRIDVTKALEAKRETGLIGSSLQAGVTLFAVGSLLRQLTSLGDDLKFVLIVSDAKVVDAGTLEAQMLAASLSVVVEPRKVRVGWEGQELPPLLGVYVAPLEHAKCERCWHVREDVGADAEHPTLCSRCVSNRYGEGEVRTSA